MDIRTPFSSSSNPASKASSHVSILDSVILGYLKMSGHFPVRLAFWSLEVAVAGLLGSPLMLIPSSWP
jgi:hypothetical protein